MNTKRFYNNSEITYIEPKIKIASNGLSVIDVKTQYFRFKNKICSKNKKVKMANNSIRVQGVLCN